MKYLLTFLLLTSLAKPTIIHEDKIMHMVAGGAIYFSCIFINREILADEDMFDEKYCLLPPLFAGIGKELYDQHQYGGFDLEDIGATMAIPTVSFVLYEW